MKYKHSPYDFSVEVVPISISGLERVLRNSRVAVGCLLDHLAPVLMETPGVLAGKNWFTLVNVSCTHTGFSYGLLEPPPERILPSGGTWYYTFALKDSGYNEFTSIGYTSSRGIGALAWGRKNAEFLTLSTTHMQASEFNIRYDAFTPEWLYYSLGALTKSLVSRNQYYTNDETYKRFYHTPLDMARAKYYMMPLYTLIRNVPYPMWVFNRHMWDLGVNLFSTKHFTEESLLYMCLYVRAIKPLPKAVEARVVDKFHESLTDLIQRRSRQEGPKETWQLLYTALANRGNIPDDYEDWLASRETELKLPVNNFEQHILDLLYANSFA